MAKINMSRWLAARQCDLMHLISSSERLSAHLVGENQLAVASRADRRSLVGRCSNCGGR